MYCNLYSNFVLYCDNRNWPNGRVNSLIRQLLRFRTFLNIGDYTFYGILHCLQRRVAGKSESIWNAFSFRRNMISSWVSSAYYDEISTCCSFTRESHWCVRECGCPRLCPLPRTASLSRWHILKFLVSRYDLCPCRRVVDLLLFLLMLPLPYKWQSWS